MEEIQKSDSSGTKILLVGALIGALAGIGTAYLLKQNAEREGEEPAISTGQG